MMSIIDEITTFTAASPAPKPIFSSVESRARGAGFCMKEGGQLFDQVTAVIVQRLLIHEGPVIGVPFELDDLQLLQAVVRGFVSVEDQVVLAIEGVDAVVADARPVLVAGKKQGAS